jgi:3',5'-cyclic AMP phosphodiesterase CpdA
MGNHDHRGRFRAALQAEAGGPPLVEDRVISIVPASRANWFILDSLDRTNVTPGILGSAQLAWLERALDAHADRPALIMVHHNPNDAINKNGLAETGPLLDLLRSRRHVKAHFFGHSHRWSVERDPSGLHLINLPTTAYPFEKTQPAGWVRAVLEPQGIRLELRAVNRTHAAHGLVHTLAWRT